jgi:riboflavin kinase/FMN adenylyltransferase
MKVYRSLDAAPPLRGGTAVAVGNFDGLHRGHRRILALLVERARAEGVPSCVLTFSPHPERVFATRAISMIQTLDQRLDGLAAAGVDRTMVLPFDRDLGRLAPATFIRRVIIGTLRARCVIVGRAFRFGRAKEGDVALLREMGRAAGFVTLAVPPLAWRGRTVSSSRIRDLLACGSVGTAGALLGRPYAIEGDVVRGEGRGRGLGFPTANLETPNEILPRGVFLTRFRVEGEDHPALTSVGVRPTFGGRSLTVETYILRFRRDIYGEPAAVRFLRKLRDEAAYSGPEALVARLRADRAAAERYFKV